MVEMARVFFVQHTLQKALAQREQVCEGVLFTAEGGRRWNSAFSAKYTIRKCGTIDRNSRAHMLVNANTRQPALTGPAEMS